MIPAKSRMTVTGRLRPLRAIVPDVCGQPRCVVIAAHDEEREQHEDDRDDQELEQAHHEAAPEPQRTAHSALLPGKGSAASRSRGGPDDGIGEHDVREPDAEVGDDDTARRPGRARRGSPRRASAVGSG